MSSAGVIGAWRAMYPRERMEPPGVDARRTSPLCEPSSGSIETMVTFARAFASRVAAYAWFVDRLRPVRPVLARIEIARIDRVMSSGSRARHGAHRRRRPRRGGAKYRCGLERGPAAERRPGTGFEHGGKLVHSCAPADRRLARMRRKFDDMMQVM